MAQFTDLDGRQWTFRMSYDAVEQIRQRLDGFDLLDTRQSLLQLMVDPAMVCNVGRILCEDEAEAAGVTPRQFGKALGGKAIADCRNAIIQEVIDFFPDQADRDRIAEAIPTLNDFVRKLRDQLAKTATDPRIKDQLLAALSECELPSGVTPES